MRDRVIFNQEYMVGQTEAVSLLARTGTLPDSRKVEEVFAYTRIQNTSTLPIAAVKGRIAGFCQIVGF